MGGSVKGREGGAGLASNTLGSCWSRPVLGLNTGLLDTAYSWDSSRVRAGDRGGERDGG